MCDNEEEAKRLAFDDPQQRRKVVTKTGLLISKSGAMTGGGSGDMGKGGSRFDDAEYHRDKEVRHLGSPANPKKTTVMVYVLYHLSWNRLGSSPACIATPTPCPATLSSRAAEPCFR